MPDLKSELTGATATPLQFSIVTPPGWARFSVDEEAERQLTQNMEQMFRDRGQPQNLLTYRMQMHKTFAELRRRNAVAIYLPVIPVDEVVLPVAIMVLPAPVRDAAAIERFAQRLESRALVGSATIDGLRVLRWEERSVVPGEEGARSLVINHLFEAPAESRRSAAVVSSALLYVDGSEGDEFTESLTVLLDAIAGTFTWEIAA